MKFKKSFSTVFSSLCALCHSCGYDLSRHPYGYPIPGGRSSRTGGRYSGGMAGRRAAACSCDLLRSCICSGAFSLLRFVLSQKWRQIWIYRGTVLAGLHACFSFKPYLFALTSRNKGNFLFPVDHLIQQPCGSTLRFPCGVSVDVHCGTDIGVSEKFLHIFRLCAAGKQINSANFHGFFILLFFSFLHFNSNAEFIITSTEPALWTSAPTTGFRIPVIASTMARKFSPIEKLKLSFIVVIIRLDRDIK